MKPTIYLDNNATTPTDPRVVEAMMPYYTEKFGNAASRNHPFGWEAEEAVENARKAIANELNCRSREIVFTSGATESVNLAIKGYCERNVHRGRHIVTQIIEHKAVLDTCSEMERRGREVTYLPVRKEGLVELDEIAGAIRDDTALVAIMHANNEIGTVHDEGYRFSLRTAAESEGGAEAPDGRRRARTGDALGNASSAANHRSGRGDAPLRRRG